MPITTDRHARGGVAKLVAKQLPVELSAEEQWPCPNGCGYAVTWHPTHCCMRCSIDDGHGVRCERAGPQSGGVARACPCPCICA